MIRFLPLLFLIIFAVKSKAQICTSDTTQIPPNALIFPLPFQDTVPGSGIQDVVCKGQDYKTVFQFKIPEKVIYLGFEVTVLEIKLKSITGLPEGLTYSCNPDGCTMPGNSNGCLAIHGIATSSNATGVYPIALNFDFTTNLGTFDLTFPSPTIAPGKYELIVEEASHGVCNASTNPIYQENIKNAWIDPQAQTFNLDFQSDKMVAGNLELYSINGTLVTSQKINLENGLNKLQMSVNNVSAGTYFFLLKTSSGYASGKIVRY